MNAKSNLFLLGLFLLGILLGFALPAHAEDVAAPVTLRAETEVAHAAIRLSDVFGGLPKGADRDIALAPAPGKSVTYDLRVLTGLAAQFKLNWKPEGLADKCVLTTAAARITPDMIQESVKHKIHATDATLGSAMEIVFDSKRLGLELPAGSSTEVTWSAFDYDTQSRRFRGEVVAQDEGRPVTQNVSGRVVIRREVPVLAKRLLSGSVVGANDLTWQTVDDSRLANDVLTDSQQIVGMELRHDLADGEALHSRDVQPPRLVTRGSLVTLKVETPWMQITAQGRALQDGSKGETVRVTNTASNRIVEGVVVGGGVVAVGFARQMASADDGKDVH